MENTYIKFEAPESLEKETLDFVENSYRSGKIKKGTNEVVKSIDRGEAKLIVIAEDVSPADVVFYLPTLCDERKVPYTYVKNKNDLGIKVGIASAASIAIVDFGKNEDAYKTIITEINDVKAGKKIEKKEKKKEVTEESKEETPKEEKETVKKAEKTEEKKKAPKSKAKKPRQPKENKEEKSEE